MYHLLQCHAWVSAGIFDGFLTIISLHHTVFFLGLLQRVTWWCRAIFWTNHQSESTKRGTVYPCLIESLLLSDILLWKPFQKKNNLHNCCPKMRQAIIISGQQLSLSQAYSFLEYDVVKIEWTQSPYSVSTRLPLTSPKTLKSYTVAVITVS